MKIIKTITTILIIGIGTFLTTTCSLPTDPGPQPKDIIDTEFEPGYNILGVLRNDGVAGTSFIRVEQAFRLTEITDEFTPVVEDLNVRLWISGSTDTVQFSMDEDSVRGKIYDSASFQPEAGAEYDLTITGGELSDLSGTVRVPPSPAIDSTSVEVSGKKVEFTLENVPGIALYDVYLISEFEMFSTRQFPAQSGKTQITISFPSSAGALKQIEIYGYESNLTEYVTAPITIKPQTYRETVTTVSGGYGVFGAVSKAVYQLR